ncbi:MAG: hypothetical protein J6I50_11060 [Clostridia bacterium]|nr:hypothetical protein [Clostridia bacterium]
MNFDRNQKTFTSPLQYEVWEQGVHVVPPEISLADISDTETRCGCMQIYDCIMEILTDMYDHTEWYIQRPRWYTGDYLAWLVNGVNPMKNHAKEYNRYLQRLPQFGFAYDAETGTWSNEKYPLFFEYFMRMVELFKTRKKNLGGYLARLDFRLFAPKIKLTLEDLLRPIPDDAQEICLDLHKFAVSQGFKVEKKDPCTFRYIHKKLYSMEISNMPFSASVIYRLDNGTGAYSHVQEQLASFLNIVEEQADSAALLEFILNGISVCTACGGQKSVRQRCGMWVELCGKKRLVSICHLSIGKDRRKQNAPFTAEDADMIKRLLVVRHEQINRYLGIS